MIRRSDLTALVSSRILHDLVSPLGAIGNGVELMGLAGLPPSAELQLIEESVSNANARIRFFRVAFGAAAPGQVLSRAEITSALAAVGRAGRIAYQWASPAAQPRDEVRLAFLLLQCLEDAMPSGGQIRVDRDADAWTIAADADRWRVDAPLWDGLTNPRARPAIAAAQVQFALVPEVLAETGRRLALKITPARITAQF